jgi:short-subunit dehydrogenase
MKLMLESGAGVVVNIASVSGHIAAPYMSAYSASKHAIVGFTRALYEEQRLLQNPIRFVLVSPGFFDSSMLKSHAKLQLGDWFKSMVGNAAEVATATVDAIVKQKFEVVPTMNGKVAIALNHFIPSTLRRASPRLLAKD